MLFVWSTDQNTNYILSRMKKQTPASVTENKSLDLRQKQLTPSVLLKLFTHHLSLKYSFKKLHRVVVTRVSASVNKWFVFVLETLSDAAAHQLLCVSHHPVFLIWHVPCFTATSARFPHPSFTSVHVFLHVPLNKRLLARVPSDTHVHYALVCDQMLTLESWNHVLHLHLLQVKGALPGGAGPRRGLTAAELLLAGVSLCGVNAWVSTAAATAVLTAVSATGNITHLFIQITH